MDGYVMDPGANNKLVGHRRWLLYSNRSTMGTGDVPAVDEFYRVISP